MFRYASKVASDSARATWEGASLLMPRKGLSKCRSAAWMKRILDIVESPCVSFVGSPGSRGRRSSQDSTRSYGVLHLANVSR